MGGSETGSGSMVVMRGLLWVQQDRIFCRWKERYVHTVVVVVVVVIVDVVVVGVGRIGAHKHSLSSGCMLMLMLTEID